MIRQEDRTALGSSRCSAPVQERVPDSTRLRVGPWSVAVALGRTDERQASPSRAATRLAEALVAELIGRAAERVRVASLPPSGRPVAVVDGEAHPVSLTISHVPGLVGAAACETAWVGIDIVDPAEAGRGLDIWFTPDELALLPDDDGSLRARLWAAKEAAYKACRFDAGFSPRSVTIDALTGSGFSWTARHRFGDVLGPGRFTSLGRHVVAVAAAPVGRAADVPTAVGRTIASGTSPLAAAHSHSLEVLP